MPLLTASDGGRGQKAEASKVSAVWVKQLECCVNKQLEKGRLRREGSKVSD